MCISTAYRAKDSSIICKNIRKLEINENEIILTDIMEQENVVIGKVVSADLIGGKVIIDCVE